MKLFKSKENTDNINMDSQTNDVDNVEISMPDGGIEMPTKSSKRRKSSNGKVGKFSRASKNESKKNSILVILVVFTVLSIAWVASIGRKAEAKVDIVMLANGAYKNQPITEDMLVKYPMLQAEYEKYSIVKDNGVETRRLILWSDKDSIIGAFAGYPIASETPLEYRSLVRSRVDNSDIVMYSFPGKDLVPLNIGASDLNAFKTFLQPGDKLNISAVYSEKVNVLDSFGQGEEEKEVFRSDPVFKNIMVADLTNSNGNSILDIYSEYNDKTTFQQAQLDSNEEFQKSITPASLFVALTPEEMTQYYKYISKNNIQFKISLPQRTQ